MASVLAAKSRKLIQNPTNHGVTRAENVDALLRVAVHVVVKEKLKTSICAISGSIYSNFFKSFNRMTIISWDDMTIGCHIKKINTKFNQRRRQTRRKPRRTSLGRCTGGRPGEDWNPAFGISGSIYPDFFNFVNKMTIISWDLMTIDRQIKKTN